ncbi:MAG TPA: hypothetical protein PLV42_09695 [bacterium]|nr:hypothetical protein [bacterium]
MTKYLFILVAVLLCFVACDNDSLKVEIDGRKVTVLLPEEHNCTYLYCDAGDYLAGNVRLYRIENGEKIVVATRLHLGVYDAALVDGLLVTGSSGYPCGTSGCDVLNKQKIPNPSIGMVEYEYIGMQDYTTTVCDRELTQVRAYVYRQDISGHFMIEFDADNCYGKNQVEFDYLPK